MSGDTSFSKKEGAYGHTELACRQTPSFEKEAKQGEFFIQMRHKVVAICIKCIRLPLFGKIGAKTFDYQFDSEKEFAPE